MYSISMELESVDVVPEYVIFRCDIIYSPLTLKYTCAYTHTHTHTHTNLSLTHKHTHSQTLEHNNKLAVYYYAIYTHTYS
jgi:hypothetical protein